MEGPFWFELGGYPVGRGAEYWYWVILTRTSLREDIDALPPGPSQQREHCRAGFLAIRAMTARAMAGPATSSSDAAVHEVLTADLFELFDWMQSDDAFQETRPTDEERQALVQQTMSTFVNDDDNSDRLSRLQRLLGLMEEHRQGYSRALSDFESAPHSALIRVNLEHPNKDLLHDFKSEIRECGRNGP